MIYDAALNGPANLFHIKKVFITHQCLLNTAYDGDITYAAPWIFEVKEEQLDWFKSSNLQAQELLWIESTNSITDITMAFQKLIYPQGVQLSKSFFRCWDIDVLLNDLKEKNSKCKQLFQIIDHIYLLKDEFMQAYYLDYWGILNKKTINNILNQ